MSAAAGCTHTEAIAAVEPSSSEGCSKCLASSESWMHLRICLSCGEVGCCDSSPNRHASKHAAGHDHPLIASFEPNEEWAWCYVDEVMLDASPLGLPSRDPYPGER